jgi:predicted DNA-binding transcriptional regulator AlpA
MNTNTCKQKKAPAETLGTDTNRLAFSTKEVMEILGVKRTTVWKLNKLGYLKPLPGIGGRCIYSRTALTNYLDGKAQA